MLPGFSSAVDKANTYLCTWTRLTNVTDGSSDVAPALIRQIPKISVKIEHDDGLGVRRIQGDQ